MRAKKFIGVILAFAMSIPTFVFAAEHTHDWYDDVNASTETENAYICECGARKYEDIAAICDYLVTFDANGGIVEEETRVTKYDKIKRLPIAYRNSDYQFEGWYTEKEGGVEITPDYVYEDDITLYAHWSIVGTRTLYFNSDGGSDIIRITKPYKTVLNVESYVPVKDGFIFDGWYLDPRTKEIKVTDFTFDEDTVLYAKWIADGSAPITMFKPKEQKSVVTPMTFITVKAKDGSEVDVPVTMQWMKFYERLQYLLRQYQTK